MVSDAYGAGRVLKASDVRLRRDDPHGTPVADRIAAAERSAFRAGYEDGFTAGALQAGAELAAAVDRLREEVVQAVAAQREALQAAREADALHLVEHALAIAEWAVRRELTSVPDAFFTRLAELLADRERGDAVDIVTSPSLVERTQRWLHATGGFGPDDAVRVVAGEDLADGEARVTMGDTTVFATFADTFERARASLGLSPDGRSYVELLGPGAVAADGADDPDDDAHDDVDDDVDEELVEVLYDLSMPGGTAGRDMPYGMDRLEGREGLDGTGGVAR